MNNKGQTLVVFLLILPFIILLMALIWEVGNLQVTKNKYENEIKDVITYGLKNPGDDLSSSLKELLDKNIDGEKYIMIDDNYITINVQENIEGIFSHLFKEQFNLDLTYTGYLKDGNVIIEG